MFKTPDTHYTLVVFCGIYVHFPKENLLRPEGTAVRLSHLLRPVGCAEVASAPTILLSPTCASGLMWALGRITVPRPMVTPEPKTTRLPLTFKEGAGEVRGDFWGSLNERGFRIHDEDSRFRREGGGVIIPNRATILFQPGCRCYAS